MPRPDRNVPQGRMWAMRYIQNAAQAGLSEHGTKQTHGTQLLTMFAA